MEPLPLTMSRHTLISLPINGTPAVPFIELVEAYQIVEHMFIPYRAKRTQVNGLWLDSKKEAERYQELLLLQLGRKIQELEVHPRFDLHYGDEKIGVYESDFQYLDNETKEIVVEDVKSKGTMTDIAKWKIKHFMLEYPQFKMKVTGLEDEEPSRPKRRK